MAFKMKGFPKSEGTEGASPMKYHRGTKHTEPPSVTSNVLRDLSTYKEWSKRNPGGANGASIIEEAKAKNKWDREKASVSEDRDKRYAIPERANSPRVRNKDK